jgi:16S rRNA (cytosine967-C5)-methyltransferase
MTLDTIGSSPPERPRHTHLSRAADALATVLPGARPADEVLRELFARHREAGSRDRARIGELLYGVLRNFFALRAALGADASPLELVAGHALRGGLADAATLPQLPGVDAAELARRLAQCDESALDDATRHNMPAWLWQALAAQYGDEAAPLARALNEQATVDLRVNTLKAGREAARDALAAEGIAAGFTPRSPLGLRLARREALQRTRAFRDGWVEPQDEGSQLLALFAEARAGETVADFCAGAGGKTLALGAAMRDRGVLHAFDTSRERLARMQPRLPRSGLTIVRPQALRGERDPRLNALAGACDAVLVDAPCSATGTLRRNPELRLRTPDLEALAAQQLAILSAAARLVKPGGRLVYATCSVLARENERVVEAFTASHPGFAVAQQLVLLPHRDATDGFFAARLLRGRPGD